MGAPATDPGRDGQTGAVTTTAALLLTGGASRRMGRDKAGVAGPGGVALGERTARLLTAVADPVVEVGPGHTGLPTAADAADADAVEGRRAAEATGAGPLAAVAGGVAWLRAHGWPARGAAPGAALVVATDLPLLDAAALAWLVGHPAAGTVVPVVDGHPQWLCARYSQEALDAAGGLLRSGERRLAALADAAPVHLAGPDEWGPFASPQVWADADTPAELAELVGIPS